MQLREKVRNYGAIIAFFCSGCGLLSQPATPMDAPASYKPWPSVTLVYGLDGPEDLVPIDHGAVVIASRLGGRNLNVIDTKSHAVSIIVPATLPEILDAQYLCPDLKYSGAFISHGLSVKREADGHDRLFVVRHGGREAIEVFQFSRGNDVKSLVWLGCVLLPKGFAANAVVGRYDGGFYATSMTDDGTAPNAVKLAKLYAGHASGKVLEWTRRGGFRSIPIGRTSGPNGIELSPDDRWLYVNGWASHDIARIDLHHLGRPARRLRVSFMPDNLRWAGDGRLIAAGVRSTPKWVLECAGTHADGAPCATRWTAVSIDPKSMTLKREVNRDDRTGFGDVSVALPVGPTLWLGAFDGHEIAMEQGELLATQLH